MTAEHATIERLHNGSDLGDRSGSAGSVDFQSALTRAPGLSRAATRRQRQALAGIGVGFLVLVSVCLLAGVLAWRGNETISAVLDSTRIRTLVSTTLERVLQAESAQRAYLLTGDDSFLPDFSLAEISALADLSSLKRITQSDAASSVHVTALGQVIATKFAELNQTISFGQRGQFGAAVEIVRGGTGRRAMDAARLIETALVELYNSRIDVAAPRQTALFRGLLVMIGVAAACVLALSLLIYRDTRRNFRLLQTRETALRQLAETLDQRVERRTRALSQVNERFDLALRAARVTVFTQRADLAVTWMSKAEPGLLPRDLGGGGGLNDGRHDDAWQDPALRLKQRVIETGEAAHGEVRVGQGEDERWYELTILAVRDDHGRISGLIGGSVEITERKEQEARIRLLMRELTHRSKNLLAVIQAIMRQTAANSTSMDDFQKRFADRLHSLAGSHDLLVLEDWSGASLTDLIRSQLGHYSDLVGSQVAMVGKTVHLRPDAAQHIGMALHELATNAAKYGALSVPTGHVRISWTVPDGHEPDAQCELEWEESDGPAVVAPTRRGFGRVVIERTVARAVNGEVSVSYPVTGVHWRLTFPRSALV